VLVQLEEVSKVYARGTSDVRALDGLTLAIEAGESLAIMGPSGSGKSTLLSILGCLDRPSSGRYLLDGSAVEALSDEALSRVRNQRIGFVFQAFHLIPQLSVAENVETPLLYRGLSAAECRARARASLARVGLLPRAEHTPSELSGGEAQRAAVARALVTEPRILLADEPTGNLDTRTGEEVIALLEELNRDGRTVVLVTHNESLARRSRRLLTMRDGKLEREERR
jgi:putative ABC transport system ATP-binding protein